MRTLGVLLLSAALVACNDTTAPMAAQPADDVLMTVEVPGRCLVGGCDPVGPDRTTLALVTITNTGASTAYLRTCGGVADLMEQQLQGGKWVASSTLVPQCALPPTPSIALAAGQSVQVNWFFEFVTSRLLLDVGTTADLSDAQTDASAAVVLRTIDTP